MKTREENIKKINEEFEKLSDEQLEAVAGGNVGQTADDSEALYESGLVKDWHSSFNTMFHWDSYSKEVDEGWRKAGIRSVTKWIGDNEYYRKVNGKDEKLSRNDAILYLKSTYKRVRKV